MKKLVLRLMVLGIGITMGIYISSKLNFLQDVVTDLSIKVDRIEVSNENVDDEFSSNLILVNSEYDDFIIDLRYATKNNITCEILYDNNLMYLQKNTLKKLIQVNEELKTKGYKLKIWDAYRPLAVQKKLWAVCPNANFIANPFTTGSNHNRGAAVDITLVTLTGQPVEMPTDFDEFGEKCRRGYKWSKKATENVDLLTDIMEKNGFTSINSEWWHFDDCDAKKYPILDYKFRDLIKK